MSKRKLPEFSFKGDLKEHYEKLKNKFTCAIAGVSLQVSFSQRAQVFDTRNSLRKGQFVESDAQDAVSKTEHRIMIVSYGRRKIVKNYDWDQKDCFMYNLLDIFFSQGRDGRKYKHVIMISNSVAREHGLSLRMFYLSVLKLVNNEESHCLIIIDLEDTDEALPFRVHHFSRHVLLILAPNNFPSIIQNNRKRITIIKIISVTEVTMKEIGTQKKQIQRSDDFSPTTTKLNGRLSEKQSIKRNINGADGSVIQAKEGSTQNSQPIGGKDFTQMINSSLVSIHLVARESRLPLCRTLLDLLLYPAVHQCNQLRRIVTSDITVRNTSFCLNITRYALAIGSKQYLGKQLENCNEEDILELLEIKLANVLYAAHCSADSFETLNESEQQILLRSICIGLRMENSNYIQVIPSYQHKMEDRSAVPVFVCFMKHNYEVQNEHLWGTYRGFRTYQRSYNLISSESLLAETDITDDKTDKKLQLDETNLASEVIALSCDELMKRHSNLEMIGFSKGKAREDILDTSDGPRIVLYVRLKSFIPIHEKPFPEKLRHPSKHTVILKVDVREGFYVPLSDNRQENAIYPSMKVPKLVMGCSIGRYTKRGSATLGPFVEIEYGPSGNERNKVDGFLTACHLFCVPDTHHTVIPVKGMVSQPAYDDQISQPMNDTSCGEVVACEYSGMVDVAVVMVTTRNPECGRFISCQTVSLRDVGLGEHLLEYRDGSISDYKECYGKTIIKIGKTTKLTVGQCLSNGGVIKLVDRDIQTRCPITGKVEVKMMKNLLQVKGIYEADGDDAGVRYKQFSDFGDSGAGVYLVKDNKTLSCVGMLIGMTSDNIALVTPIQNILSSINEPDTLATDYNYENLTVTLKKFP